MAFFTRVQKKLQDKFGSVCYNKTHKKFSKEEARLRNFFRRQPCRKGMNNIEWFRKAKYGMMVHFGLYSMLAGEYRGRRTPYDYGEWIQSAFAIPNREMEQLAGAFNPVYFNAEEWVKLAKECGMTYFVVTSKHHEGLHCLIPTAMHITSKKQRHLAETSSQSWRKPATSTV